MVPLAPLAPQCGVPATQMEVLFGGTGEWGLAIPGAQFPGARTATPSWEWHSPGVITVLGDHLQSLPWAQQTSPCFRATQEGGDDAASFQAGQRCSRKAVQGATQLLRVGVPSLANLRHTRPQPGRKVGRARSPPGPHLGEGEDPGQRPASSPVSPGRRALVL